MTAAAKRAKAEPAGPASEAAMTVLLGERYRAPEFAFMPQVRNGTGWSRRTTRTADALAMSLWPSRGLELLGFELKSDRRDWLNEKADPEKAEEIARFCDRWWMVAGSEDIVRDGELPPTWGLLVVNGKGELVQKVEAPKLDAKPLDKIQLAAILRRAQECVVPQVQIQAELERAAKRAEDRAKKDAAAEAKGLIDQVERLAQRIKTFEKASGVDIDHWKGPERIGAAVKFVMEGGLKRERTRLLGLHSEAQAIAALLAEHVKALPPEEDARG